MMNKVAKTTKGTAKAKRPTQAEHSGAGPVHPLLHLQQGLGNRALSELLDGKVQCDFWDDIWGGGGNGRNQTGGATGGQAGGEISHGLGPLGARLGSVVGEAFGGEEGFGLKELGGPTSGSDYTPYEELQQKPDLQRQEGPEEEELQLQPEEEEELLQAKPEIQRQEEDPLKLKALSQLIGKGIGGIGSALGMGGTAAEKPKWEDVPQVYSDKGQKGYGPNPATGGIPLPFDPARDKEIGGPKKPTMVGPKGEEIKPKPKLGKTDKLKFEEF